MDGRIEKEENMGEKAILVTNRRKAINGEGCYTREEDMV
jgi:hypothetical protein